MKRSIVKILVLCFLSSVITFAVSCVPQNSTSESAQSESLFESDMEESVLVHVCDYAELKCNFTHHWYECGCGKKIAQTTHSGGRATCIEKAECATCGQVYGELGDHEGGEATCIEKAECVTCGQVYGELGDHNYVNKECSVCGEVEVSQGLKYSLSGDGTYYKVRGMGTCTDNDLIIPNTYNNLPVKEISLLAFDYCTSLTSVVIGNNVITIGNRAFAFCTGLTSVVIGDSVTTIDEEAFYSCDSLKSVRIPDSVTTIGESAFMNCYSLISVIIGNGVLDIGSSAFERCISLTSVVIGDSVTIIGERAFSDCESLTSVVIGNGVTSIGDYAFAHRLSLTSIKYRGTEEQWLSISKGIDWDDGLGECTITYNYQD